MAEMGSITIASGDTTVEVRSATDGLEVDALRARFGLVGASLRVRSGEIVAVVDPTIRVELGPEPPAEVRAARLGANRKAGQECDRAADGCPHVLSPRVVSTIDEVGSLRRKRFVRCRFSCDIGRIPPPA